MKFINNVELILNLILDWKLTFFILLTIMEYNIPAEAIYEKNVLETNNLTHYDYF